MTFGIGQLETRNWNFKNDVTITGNFRKSDGRYVLEEYFSKLPSVNASTAYSVNENFEILGTNASADDVTVSTTRAGILCETDGADNDQVIVLPHLTGGLSTWTGVRWGTENQVIWECAISTAASVAGVLIWAGLKLTNTPTIATDNDQVFFRFDADTDTYWNYTYSIGGTDTTTNTTVAPAASTIYKFRIEIDSSRKAHFYINNSKVGVSTALTNDVDLIPYVGIQAVAAAAKSITIHYEKISRILFE